MNSFIEAYRQLGVDEKFHFGSAPTVTCVQDATAALKMSLLRYHSDSCQLNVV